VALRSGTVPTNCLQRSGVDEKSQIRCTSGMAETALVVLFPELEPLVGEFRRLHTHDGWRDMPAHATLVYPFADDTDVASLLPAIERELGAFAPFEVSVRATGRFPELLYLRPDPPEPFVEMTEALTRAFPEFPPYGGAFDEIVPHITVAGGDSKLLDRIEASLDVDVRVRVERAWLVHDTAEGWRRHTAFPLNGRTRA
jgi:2'-5' RNA ligase